MAKRRPRSGILFPPTMRFMKASVCAFDRRISDRRETAAVDYSEQRSIKASPIKMRP